MIRKFFWFVFGKPATLIASEQIVAALERIHAALVRLQK
jgi:hypothetical protein